jgi:acyl-CoA dehydrogenase
MIIKKQYGGLEFSAFAQSCVLQKFTSKSARLSSIVGVPNSLGPGSYFSTMVLSSKKTTIYRT